MRRARPDVHSPFAPLGRAARARRADRRVLPPSALEDARLWGKPCEALCTRSGSLRRFCHHCERGAELLACLKPSTEAEWRGGLAQDLGHMLPQL